MIVHIVWKLRFPKSMFQACRNPERDGDGHVAQSLKCLIIMAGCIGAVWRPQCPSFLASHRKKSRKVASPRPHHCLSYLSPNRSGGAGRRISSNYFFGEFLSSGNNWRRRIKTFYRMSGFVFFLFLDSIFLTATRQLVILWWEGKLDPKSQDVGWLVSQ